MGASETSRSAQQRSGRAVAPPLELVTLALRCPVCNTEFASEIPSPGAPEGRDSDLRPRFSGLDPLPSLVQSCPSCLYSGYQHSFVGALEEIDDLAEQLSQRPGDRPASSLGMPSEDDLDDLRRWIRRGELAKGMLEGREPFGAERYLLAARCHEYVRDDDPFALSDYYLRASWAARSTRQTDLERQAQREAITRMQQALDQGIVPEDDKPRALYLVGELSRRSGDFAKAVDFFTQLEPSSESTESEEPEELLFSALAKRMLSLAEVKSDIDALLPEDELEIERDDDLD